jgi:hypothetical protein
MTSHISYRTVYSDNRALRRSPAYLLQMLTKAIKYGLRLNTLLSTVDKINFRCKIYYYYDYQYTDPLSISTWHIIFHLTPPPYDTGFPVVIAATSFDHVMLHLSYLYTVISPIYGEP